MRECLKLFFSACYEKQGLYCHLMHSEYLIYISLNNAQIWMMFFFVFEWYSNPSLPNLALAQATKAEKALFGLTCSSQKVCAPLFGTKTLNLSLFLISSIHVVTIDSKYHRIGVAFRVLPSRWIYLHIVEGNAKVIAIPFMIGDYGLIRLYIILWFVISYLSKRLVHLIIWE